VKLSYNDKVHGYWLDGKRCRGISTLSSVPDDKFQLEQWKRRMTAIGIAYNDDLRDEVLAIHSKQAVATEQRGLNEVVDEAIDRAGANLAAERGSADHAVTEKHDKGEAFEETAHLTALRWKGLLEYAGIDVEYTERTVVYPDRLICGRFDRLGRRRADGRLVTLDLKTGSSAVRYPHSVAVQLALYANAPLLAGEWEGADGDTDVFTPLPADLDKTTGYMMYVPPEGEAALYAVNLRAGWKCVEEVVFPTLDWRTRKHDTIIAKL
jgi:hypothetical protein